MTWPRRGEGTRTSGARSHTAQPTSRLASKGSSIRPSAASVSSPTARRAVAPCGRLRAEVATAEAAPA